MLLVYMDVYISSSSRLEVLERRVHVWFCLRECVVVSVCVCASVGALLWTYRVIEFEGREAQWRPKSRWFALGK